MAGQAELRAVEDGFRALKRGDAEPLVALLDADARWVAAPEVGVAACEGREEIAARLRGIGARASEFEARFRLRGDRVVVELRPRDGSEVHLEGAGATSALWQTVETRDGRIVNIADHFGEPPLD